MKQLARIGGIVVSIMWAAPAWAENSVVIESKTVLPNATGVTIGIKITNDVGITGAVFPIEYRTLSGGAYVKTRFTVAIPSNNRLGGSPLGANFSPGANVTNGRSDVTAMNCSSPGRNSYNVDHTLQISFTSPDGFIHATFSTGDPAAGDNVDMDPGSDPSFAAASIILTMDVNGLEGEFVFDTCCFRPANHLAFVDRSTQLIAPSFTMGVVTICACHCHGDPFCDEMTDIQDVVGIIDVALRGHAAMTDPGCPYGRADVDCNGVIDIIDVVRTISVAFKGDPGPVQTCTTCGM